MTTTLRETARSVLIEIDALKLDPMHPLAIMASHLRDAAGPPDAEIFVEVDVSALAAPIGTWNGSLDEFFAVNEFDDEEKDRIRDYLAAGDDYAIGGGAAPLMWLRRDLGCGGPGEIAGYSHACGYHD